MHQRACKQLHLHTTGKPEEVSPLKELKAFNKNFLKIPVCFHRNCLQHVQINACICVYRSSTGQPDWTCVVVGFTTGYVRFYTEVRSDVRVVFSLQYRAFVNGVQFEI